MISAGNCLALFPLSCAAVLDFRRRIIPNWTVLLIFCCAILNIAAGALTLQEAVLGTVVTGAIFLLTAMHRNGIGGGDVKLCAALGAVLGLERMLFLTVLALLALVIGGKINKQNSMPLAPFAWGAFCLLQILTMICK